MVKWNYYDPYNLDELNPDIVIYDYIASIGLIKRTYYVNDVVITSLDYPEGYATVDVVNDYVLTYFTRYR